MAEIYDPLAYMKELPTPKDLREMYAELRGVVWRDRDEFIDKARQMMGGTNSVDAPKNPPYKVKVARTRMLTAAVAEKRARFLRVPSVQVVPRTGSDEERKRSTEMENAINAAFMELERTSATSTWDAVVEDCIYLDEGVEKIMFLPTAWPELTVLNENGQPVLAGKGVKSIEEWRKLTDEYKKQAEFPFRSDYVPLEAFYPHEDGVVTIESLELERRSLSTVLRNPHFSAQAKGELMAHSSEPSRADQMKTDVVILHYANAWIYAYYALGPGVSNHGSFPNGNPTGTSADLGEPILMHWFPHMLGRVPYNRVPGRFGHWARGTSRIEPVTGALIELGQTLDELNSQGLSNTWNIYWPNLKWILNPEWREVSGGRPKPPSLTAGAPIELYLGEDLAPVFQPQRDPTYELLRSDTRSLFDRIAGAEAVYGQRQEGIDAGYHQNLQLAQSEHLDEKLEQGMAAGVVERANLILLWAKAINEDILVPRTETKRVKGQELRHLDFASIKVSEIEVLPRMDARVRKPRSIDFNIAVRVARDASADRAGENTPLLPDSMIWEELLGMENPDVIHEQILIQSELRKLIQEGFITQQVRHRIGLSLAEEGGTGGPESMAGADPALQAAIAGIGPEGMEGGLNPALAGEASGMASANAPGGSSANGARRPGGFPAGGPQEEVQIAQLLEAARARGGTP